MEDSELASGLDTTLETKTQVLLKIHDRHSHHKNIIIDYSFKMFFALVLINY